MPDKEIDFPLKLQLSKAVAKVFLAELEPPVTKLHPKNRRFQQD
jgi:hypothetical protein